MWAKFRSTLPWFNTMLCASDMDADVIPPLLNEPVASDTKNVSRWRWWVHLLLLGALPLIVGVEGYLGRHRTTALLPASVPGLLAVSVEEFFGFMVLFAIAWLASRVTAKQLFLPWRGGVMPLVLGFAFSIALRVAVMVMIIPVVLIWLLINGFDAQHMQNLRPGTEHLLDASALTRSPLYLVLCLTLVSFVVAGVREELWRSGMFAGFRALFPRWFTRWQGQIFPLLLVSLIFGLGHTVQGALGVCATTLLGIGLGALILWQRSIWMAVIAHGFFDASTFVALYLLTKYNVGPFHG